MKYYAVKISEVWELWTEEQLERYGDDPRIAEFHELLNAANFTIAIKE